MKQFQLFWKRWRSLFVLGSFKIHIFTSLYGRCKVKANEDAEGQVGYPSCVHARLQDSQGVTWTRKHSGKDAKDGYDA
jgi:hypothetical protein